MVPMVSGTVSISKEEVSRLTSRVSASERLKSSMVSDGVFKPFIFILGISVVRSRRHVHESLCVEQIGIRIVLPFKPIRKNNQ